MATKKKSAKRSTSKKKTTKPKKATKKVTRPRRSAFRLAWRKTRGGYIAHFKRKGSSTQRVMILYKRGSQFFVREGVKVGDTDGYRWAKPEIAGTTLATAKIYGWATSVG
jgi:hypothetical protein